MATALNDVDNIGQNGWVQSSTCARADGRRLVADDDKLKGGGTPLLMCVASAVGKLAFQELKMRTAASRQARHKCKGFISVFVILTRDFPCEP